MLSRTNFRKFSSNSRSDRIGILGLGTLGIRIAKLINSSANIEIKSSGRIESSLHYLPDTYPSNQRPIIIEATTKPGEIINHHLIQPDQSVNLYRSNVRLAKRCSTIFISVKPDQVPEVCQEIIDQVKSDDIIISVAAGVKLRHLNQWLPTGKKVLMMPNLPIEVQSGSIALYSEDLAFQDIIQIQDLLVGSNLVWLDREEKIDLATAVSGCSPAYISYFLEKMISTGTSIEVKSNKNGKIKLTEAEVESLLIPAFQGVSDMLNDYTPLEIISLTACKGGATERAVKVFDHQQIGEIIKSVQSTALDRIGVISSKLDNL